MFKRSVDMQKMYEDFIKIIKREVVPALGCTEPVAVALAAATAKKHLGKLPENIEVLLSRNVLKNGMGVGIPGTGMIGLHIAAALGAVGGDSEKSLEVLETVSDKDIEKAKEMTDGEKVSVAKKRTEQNLYIEVICRRGERFCRVVIEESHSNISFIESETEVILDKRSKAENSSGSGVESVATSNLSVENIYKFAMEADIESIEFILHGANMNWKLAIEGMKRSYGLEVGRTLKVNSGLGIISSDVCNSAISMAAAASDARMGGSTLPAMANSGSGNQGVTVMVPVMVFAEHVKADREKLIRALILGNLMSIHLKTFLGRLAALCGVVTAATGAGAAITVLLGGEVTQVKHVIKNMIGNIAGMFCDGAKPGCALKVATAVSAAIQCSLLAINNKAVSEYDGIVEKDIEKTIRNLAAVGSKGMVETDKMILDIMVCK